MLEGDPRNVLCEAVEKHQASMLVVGSHGFLSNCIVKWKDEQDGILFAWAGFGVHIFVP